VNLKSKTKKQKNMIALFLSLFLVLVVIFVGVLFYESPYKKNTAGSSGPSFKVFVRDLFSGVKSGAKFFTEPLDEVFGDSNIQ